MGFHCWAKRRKPPDHKPFEPANKNGGEIRVVRRNSWTGDFGVNAGLDLQPTNHRILPGMIAHTESFEVTTRGKGTYEITDQVAKAVRNSGIKTGLVTVFIQHTSASLIIFENADRSARVDLEEYFERLVPEDTDYFVHTAEGPDDSTSHVRMVLTRTSESVPVANGQMQLGTWQGIFVFEHRLASHQRRISVSVVGG